MVLRLMQTVQYYRGHFLHSDLLKYGRILSLIQNCSVVLYMTYKCIRVSLLSFIFLGMCGYMLGQERKLLINESIVRYTCDICKVNG
jgi:hypothetical protein